MFVANLRPVKRHSSALSLVDGLLASLSFPCHYLRWYAWVPTTFPCYHQEKNHPYAAFAPDAPWEISYDGVLYLDQVLNPTIRSTLTLFGLFVDFPVYHDRDRTLEERVLFLGVPNNFYDPQSTLIYSMVWHTMTASLSELHHTSVEDCFNRLRGWCLFFLDVHRVALNYSYIPWISRFMRLIGDAVIDCAWAMLPPNMRTYFAQHHDKAPYFTVEPPNYVLRHRQ